MNVRSELDSITEEECIDYYIEVGDKFIVMK
jgi:hypothetical protein